MFVFIVLASFSAFVLATGIWVYRSKFQSGKLGLSRHHQKDWSSASKASPVFLFEHSRLTQANAAGLRFLGQKKTGDMSWPEVRSVLAEIVPQIPVSLKALEDGATVYPEQIEPLAHHLSIEQQAPFTRIELQFGDAFNPQTPGQECLEAPFPIWAEADDGSLLWKNRAFNRAGFAVHLKDALRRRARSNSNRFSLPESRGKAPKHYRLFKKKVAGSTIFYAHSAEETVAAETSRQDVVQTLGKTFAQLSTGLVVFDSEGNLVLFNPAVIDLFGFSAGFLSARPSIESFFDHMRDNRMIPEPKNYVAWREQIADQISNSAENRFRENWQLPNGATIRASGLPNPEGGVGFLFEDISSQVSTTRRFRDELALSHTLLDAMDDAIAAVDALGRVVFANKSFQRYWKVDPESSFADFTVTELLNAMQRDISPKHLGRIARFLAQSDKAQEAHIACLRIAGIAVDVHLVRAKGQLIMLRHAVPSEIGASPTKILTT